MDNYCRIWFGQGQTIEIDVEPLYKWCPGLVKLLRSSFFINGNELVYNIDSDLPHSIPSAFNERATRKVLIDLFNHWRSDYLGHRRYKTRAFLQNIMDEELQKEAHIRRPYGLTQSRHRFLVYCLLAKATGSSKLAKSMVEIFQNEVAEIVENENQEFLREWYLGILELRGLISEQTITETLQSTSDRGSRRWDGWSGLNKHDPLTAWMMLQIALNARQNTASSGSNRRRISDGREDNRPSSVPPSVWDRNWGQNRRYNQWNDSIAKPTAWPNFFEQMIRLQQYQAEVNLKLDNIDEKLDNLLRKESKRPWL